MLLDSLFLDIAKEKQEKQLVNDIETFGKDNLKQTETAVKEALPTQQGLYREKCVDVTRLN